MVHQDTTHCRLDLAGRLCGPWVGETERAWHLATCSGKQIEVDLREITGVDGAGRALLAAMHGAGARLIADGVWMRTLLEDIAAKRSFDGGQAIAAPKERTSRLRFPDQERHK
jgi:hypothetical protein